MPSWVRHRLRLAGGEARCETSCAAAEALRMRRAPSFNLYCVTVQRPARSTRPVFKPAPLSEANHSPQGADDGLICQSSSASRFIAGVGFLNFQPVGNLEASHIFLDRGRPRFMGHPSVFERRACGWPVVIIRPFPLLGTTNPARNNHRVVSPQVRGLLWGTPNNPRFQKYGGSSVEPPARCRLQTIGLDASFLRYRDRSKHRGAATTTVGRWWQSETLASDIATELKSHILIRVPTMFFATDIHRVGLGKGPSWVRTYNLRTRRKSALHSDHESFHIPIPVTDSSSISLCKVREAYRPVLARR